MMTSAEFAKFFDHTILKPDATAAEVLLLCAEAREAGFAAACVAPCWVALAADMLKSSGVVVASVVGFPHGNTLQQVKSRETAESVALGAMEIDMVLNVGLAKDGAWERVEADIRAVVKAARIAPGVVVKVILENALLTDEEKQTACRVCEAAGADFVKTSTGFAASGATVEDVVLMRRVVGNRLGVKAAGGIRDLATAEAMIAAGANRLGSSASLKILAAFNERAAHTP